MAARPRKKLDTRSNDFGIRCGLHLRTLLDKRKLTTAEFRELLRIAGLDVSPTTVKFWLTGQRLPIARDFETIGEALKLRDYRQALPPPK